MTRLLPLVAIALSLGALAFAAMPRDSEFMPPPPSGPSVDEQARDTALEQRITNLESQNRALWERVQTLEAARGGAVAPAPVAALPTEPASPDAVKAAVDQVLADRERERLEARQHEMEVRAKDADIRWSTFTSKAQLTMDQMNALNRGLEAEREARRQSTASPGEDTLGRSMRSLREAQRRTDEEVLPMLNEQQRQQYQQVRREERRRPDQRKN